VPRLTLRTTEAHRGRRLEDVVGEWLRAGLERPLGRAVVRRLIMAGVVRVDGRALRAPGRSVVPGRLLQAEVDAARLPVAAAESGTASPQPHVLYEDDVLLAVDKPAGLATVPTADPSQPSVFSRLRAWLDARKGAGAYLGVHQRLDRDTTGVVLFATDPAANAGLASAFDSGRVVKTYDALTRRPQPLPPRRWTVEQPLARIGRSRMAVSADGADATTEFERRTVFPAGLWVRAWPKTGRTHQVRVHLASAGAAILGDAVYAPREDARRAPRVMLHAAVLELPHPVTGKALRIASPWPADFQELMADLGRRPRASRSRKTPR
jgi:RluA family pseudouridine synthase